MDYEPPFCTKKVIFGPIFANFCPEISSLDPKHDSDWYETNVRLSKDTENIFLTD